MSTLYHGQPYTSKATSSWKIARGVQMMLAYNYVQDRGYPDPMPFSVTKAAMFTQLTDKMNKSTKRRESKMSLQGVPESCEGTLLQRKPRRLDSYPQAAVSVFTLIVPNSIPAMVWFTPSNNSSREMTKLSGCLALYWVLLNSSSEPLSGRLVC